MLIFCVVTERWAEHIASLFSGFTDEQMDAFYLDNGYIPRGIYWDLHDVVNDNEVFFVNDAVGGFTNNKIFDVLNSRSINELKIRLWDEHGSETGIIGSHDDYNDLFLSYGY